MTTLASLLRLLAHRSETILIMGLLYIYNHLTKQGLNKTSTPADHSQPSIPLST